MSNSNGDIHAARRNLSAALHALEVSARWQKQEADKAVADHDAAMKAAQATKQKADQETEQYKKTATAQANQLRDEIEAIVKNGDGLYGHADLGKNKPALAPPVAPFAPPGSPQQTLQRLAQDSQQAYDTLKRELAELDSAREANRRLRNTLIIIGAVLISAALIAIVVLAR